MRQPALKLDEKLDENCAVLKNKTPGALFRGTDEATNENDPSHFRETDSLIMTCPFRLSIEFNLHVHTFC